MISIMTAGALFLGFFFTLALGFTLGRKFEEGQAEIFKAMYEELNREVKRENGDTHSYGTYVVRR